MFGKPKDIINKMTGKSLYNDVFFWCLFLIPIFLGIFFSTIIIWNGNYSLDMSAKGFSLFYNDFKVPLLTASMSLPFSGLYAAIFRSKQAADQMSLTERNNIFNNHFLHQEKFKEFIDDNCKDFSKTTGITISKFHKIIFPNTIKGIHSPSHKIKSKSNQLYLQLKEFNPIISFDPLKTYELEKHLALFRNTTGISFRSEISNLEYLKMLDVVNNACSFFGEQDAISNEVIYKLHNMAREEDTVSQTCKRGIKSAMEDILKNNKMNAYGGEIEIESNIKKNVVVSILLRFDNKTLIEYIKELKKYSPKSYEFVINAIESFEGKSETTCRNMDKLFKLRDI